MNWACATEAAQIAKAMISDLFVFAPLEKSPPNGGGRLYYSGFPEQMRRLISAATETGKIVTFPQSQVSVMTI